MAECTKLTNLPYYFQIGILTHFLEHPCNRPTNAQNHQCNPYITFSHMAVSKGFVSTPGIVTWHKISEHMCPICTLHNGSSVTLRLVPSPSSILQPSFHKLCLSGFVSHTSKLKVSVSRVHKFPNTLTIVLTQENLRRW